MSKRNLKSAKSSKTKIDKKKLDIYDQFRPHSGIKYYLSQTEVNWNAGVPRLHLQQTAVEYEPGQDLTTPPVEQEEYVMRYTKRKCRGPVWKFQEEIEAEKREERAKEMKKIVMKRLKASAGISASAQNNKVHDHIIHSIGPKWYHELSNKQMHTADNLKDALLKDHMNKTVQNTQDMLTDLGLAVWPHHTKIAYALKKYYQCPVEFLLKLYQLNRSKDEIRENSYTLDNKILLSAVVHLTMRNTLRELHLRIPSPPKVKKGKHTAQVNKKLKNHPSPYLDSFPFIPQPEPDAIAKHRRKEYPKSRYFNYVDDMYEVYYEVQSESTIRKQMNKKHQSKYDKPPKIPVRQLARKLIGEKKYRLGKPSVYINPCDDINEEPKKLIIPEDDENISSKISKEDTTVQQSIKKASIKEKSAATIVTKQSEKTLPSPEENGQKLDDEAMKDEQAVDKEEEITEDCTCEPVRESKIEKKPAEDKFYLCTCGQADKEEKERNYNKQRYQRNKQFIYNLNMFNIENNTFYYPCTCHHGQMNKKIESIKEENKDTRNKEHKGDADIKEQNDKTENKQEINKTQNKEPTDDQNKEQTDDDQNKEKPDKTQNKEKSDKKPDGEQTGQDEKPKQKQEDKKLKKSIKLDITDQKDNVNPEENIVQKGNRTIRKSMANIKVSVANEGDTTESIDKDKSDEEEIKEDDDDEESSEPKKDEKCRCMKLYGKYMDTHEYCLDLFEDYKLKIKADIKEYMKDIEENRCTCGDSSEICNEYDITEDNNIEEIVKGCSHDNTNRKHDKMEGVNVEEIMEGCSCSNIKKTHGQKEDVSVEEIVEGCNCGNAKRKQDKKHDVNNEEIMEGYKKHRKPTKDQCAMCDMNDFMGCTCVQCDCGIGNANGYNSGTNAYYRCTCGDNEDQHTTINGFKLCTCKTKQDHASMHRTNKDTSILSTIPEEIDDTNQVNEECKTSLSTSKNKQKIQEQLSHSKVSKKSSSKTEHTDEDIQEEIQVTSGTEVAKEVDPRIFALKKFPKKRKQQMILLKKVLAALAQDGYPLAKLPDCHKLPHFQVWMDKRSGKYLTIAQRTKYLEESRRLWNHTEICKRQVSLPELGIHPSVARKMTWEGAYKYKRMITDTMYGFSRKLKQAYVSEAQEFFPTTFHHKMPNKTFRDCFFAYLPSDEHQINVYRPWQLHEY